MCIFVSDPRESRRGGNNTNGRKFKHQEIENMNKNELKRQSSKQGKL